MRSASNKVLAAALILPLLSAPAPRAEDWPQWRGPNRDGVCGETGLLESFPPEGLKIRWRVPVGWGFASPVVAQGRVFLADSEMLPPKARERLHCFDEATGKTLWTHAYEVAYPDWAFSPEQEIGPVATPIARDGKVYTQGRLNHLFCLDARTGEVLWQKNLESEYQAGFAPGAPSPLIEGDLLILFIGGKSGACVVALHKDTGRQAWKALEETLTYSSPIVISSGGKRQLIVWTQESVTSLDPVAGTTYWRQKLLTSGDYAVSTPVSYQDRLLIGGLMFQLESDRPAATVLWPASRAPARRIFSHTSTALFQGNYLFSGKSSGELICLEASTGRQIWESTKVTALKNGASIHLTPNGDSVFLYTDGGELIRARLTPEGYQEIGRFALLEPTMPFGGRKVAWSPPAYANRHIFARSGKELVCASLAAARDEERREGTAAPAEEYQALLKERERASDDLSNAKTDEERRKVSARLGNLPLRFLALAEANPQDPVAVEALIQTVSWVNSTSFPAGGEDSPGERALALLSRDHLRSDKLGLVCQLIAFGFHRSHERFLRAVLETSPLPEVQGLACLSLAQFLNDRLNRLEILRDQDGPELRERYHRVFGRDLLEELERQDRAAVSRDAEALFARAAEKYHQAKIPVTYYGSGGTVGEKAETELFQVRHLAVGKVAPEIEGEDQDGKKLKLSDYRGKVVLLDFWYHL